ncbi:M23 family metallopeptidase [Colwellia sp. MSW7]|uniref:M23 family metallopeptidase n=1 Tax=Colwellia maritima TaxID=2912588 RepID=A0ABS9X457_9GAMM|nr:M23 family metallopeptidase [Colwellia maritima]MCI2285006.1 M23 family metallopeptidase [Colwellia maritima]
MRLNKLHWLSAVLIFSLVSGGIIHLLFSMDEKPMQESGYFTSGTAALPSNEGNVINIVENNAVHSTRSDAKNQQVTALTVKLAELQSHVLRLNALGERLADNANIPEQEFNFSKLPPSGGPSSGTSESSKKSFTQLLTEITELEGSLNHEENQLHMLESLILGHHIENTRYLSGRPITKGWLSSYFGVRKDPFNGRATMHKGIDFGGKEDGDIIATAAGIVSWSDERHGYGQLIEINHGDGLKTRYAHNKKLLVAVGDVVTKGQIIAKMGSTGRSTGPHVHYEILHNNKQINPLKFVYRKAK